MTLEERDFENLFKFTCNHCAAIIKYFRHECATFALVNSAFYHEKLERDTCIVPEELLFNDNGIIIIQQLTSSS